ncbi:MAG: PAS domain S-box protein, partial [Methanobacteriota archaeon]
ISDYQMPDMDGIEFLRKVRGSGDAIPFILFTGRGREEVVIQALNEGADFYLQKGGDPCSQFTELSHKIRQAVRQRRLETSVRNHKRREEDIINFLPDATFAINSDRIIIAWNRAIERLTGVSSEQMLGKGDFEYALPFYRERRPLLIDLVLKDYPETYSTYSSIKREEDHLSAEVTLSHFHNGTGASFWFTASPLYDTQGTIVGAIESIREVTEIKRAEQNILRNHEELQAAYEQISAAEEELRSNIDEITRQEQAARESEHQLHAMATNIPGVVYRFYVNPDGTYGTDYISERSKQILGLENDLTNFSDWLTQGIIPDDRDRFISSVQHAITTISPWEFIGQYQKPSGEKIWLKGVASPIRDHDKLIFDGVIFDDTERKLIEEFNRLLAKMADDAPASITVHDFEGTMLYANDMTFQLHGYSREEFLAKNLHDIDVPETEQLIAERMQQIHENGAGDFNVYHMRKDGSKIPLHVSAKIIEWGGRKVLLSIASDISDLKRSDEALHEANQKLRLLTGLVRHDIFNQLTVVKGCHILAMEESDPAKVQEYLSHAWHAGERIEKTIGFTKEYEEFGIASSEWQLIHHIIDGIMVEVSFASVTIHNLIPDDLEVYADPIIRKVFSTLLENAITHGGKITIIQFSCLEQEDTLIISCIDDGVGIPFDKKDMIFDHKYGENTKVGLFLIREILSITGLSIRESGTPGIGARFEILVPPGKYRIH